MSGLLPLGRGGSGPSFPEESVLSWLNDCYGLEDVLELQAWTHEGDAVSGDAPLRQREVGRSREWFPGDDGASRTPAHGGGTGGTASRVSAPCFIRAGEDSLRGPSAVGTGRDRVGTVFRGRGGGGRPGKGTSLRPPDPRILGVLVHRLLECCGRRQDLPSLDAIAGLARREGAEGDDASALARSALSEVTACLEDPLLREFYRLPDDLRLVERPLEAVRSSRTLLSGVVDLAVFHENRWRLVDFKTSRGPAGEDPVTYCKRESEAYRPQLTAYRNMWAKLKGVPETEVDVAVFWTAYGRWERIREDLTGSPSGAS